jgi:hypothetical protein
MMADKNKSGKKVKTGKGNVDGRNGSGISV